MFDGTNEVSEGKTKKFALLSPHEMPIFGRLIAHAASFTANG